METPQPPDRPDPDQPPSPDAPPPPPGGPQAPAGPQAPSGPQAPGGYPAPPGGPQAPGGYPAPPGGPQAPGGYPAPPGGPQAPGGPEGPPSYGGPVPPGGWQQPIAQQPSAWHGRQLASWGSRLGAWLIDILIIAIPANVIFWSLVAGAIGITGDDNDTGVGVLIGAALLSVLVFAVCALIYAPATMARGGEHNGQTWGKQLTGIRVIRDRGQPMDFWWAALREVGVKGLLVGIASSIIPLIPWFLNFFWPLWDDQNRAVHDMLVSTHVVQA